MKTVKTLLTVIALLTIIPALSSLAITSLWNAILIPACGFAPLGFLQGAGLFILGQILSGGFLILVFLTGGTIHHFVNHANGDWHSHWQSMSDEQRREFIERRRREHFGHHNRDFNEDNVSK